MERWFFTFGYGQEHEGHYVIVHGINFSDARKIMISKYGTRWCGQYSEEQWNSPNNLCSKYRLLEEVKKGG